MVNCGGSGYIMRDFFESQGISLNNKVEYLNLESTQLFITVYKHALFL